MALLHMRWVHHFKKLANHNFRKDEGEHQALHLQRPGDLRGSGIFPMASLLNHDCLPNTVRFDGFDQRGSRPAASVPGDKQMTLRAIHDLPAGEELTISYFPLSLSFQQRQQRCQQLYGFSCRCLRCQRESEEYGARVVWRQEEQSWDRQEEASQPAGAGQTAPLLEEAASGQKIDEGYIYIFLRKFVCDKEECGGTLAPISEKGLSECNKCGAQRTEEQFLKLLEEHDDASSDGDWDCEEDRMDE